VSWYTTYRSAMLVATCNRLFQISSETRTIEIDDSIVRRCASDTERDRESYTEVCDVCLSRPIISDVQACPILTSAHLDRRLYGRPRQAGHEFAATERDCVVNAYRKCRKRMRLPAGLRLRSSIARRVASPRAPTAGSSERSSAPSVSAVHRAASRRSRP
jgi:hypothetical protein